MWDNSSPQSNQSELHRINKLNLVTTKIPVSYTHLNKTTYSLNIYNLNQTHYSTQLYTTHTTIQNPAPIPLPPPHPNTQPDNQKNRYKLPTT